MTNFIKDVLKISIGTLIAFIVIDYIVMKEK